ncbi:helix-turn-helix domain-containing protein [Vannielia litorea]|uniref:helix-turn-helix domain-containing protein n=1 Tax=Vannielia litorea TaxID=1217970 RepID=UPI001BCD9F94|nr:helix-turn-helix domain-containing protein [Vannielia litorea]MBS8227393.1 XRE family transcriptional regulator [Vannielia litorea]
MSDFATELRRWRGVRRLSQLALAGEAGVSARHVSFLESGRARPSREMVIRLGRALEVPPAGTNVLMEAAGFAPMHRASGLDDAHVRPMREAMERVLERHAPWPGLLLDRTWHILRMNRPAQQLFAMAGLAEGESLLGLLDPPGRAVELIENWPEVGRHTLARLRAESRAAGGIDALDRAAAKLAADPAVADGGTERALAPVLATIYRASGMRLALWSTYMQIGGAEDLALTDLKAELMFPADAEAEALLEALAR